MNQNKSFTYIHSLDVLRSVGVLFVLLYHGTYGNVRGGWIGVDIFFVLSGFLITSLLQQEYKTTGTVSFGNFYLRRALRLIPVLILGVILSNCLWSFTEQSHNVDRGWATAGALLYFTNLLNGKLTGNLSHLWSLSVEEHFYLVFPLFALYLLFPLSHWLKVRYLLLLYFTLCVFRIIVANYEQYLFFGVFSVDSNRFTLCKFDGILLGALLSFLPEEKLRSFPIWLPSLLLSTLLILTFMLGEHNSMWRSGGFIVTDLLCFVTVFTAVVMPNYFLFKSCPLTWIGKRSYGIYVYHFPIFLFLERYRITGSSLNFALIIFLRFTISFAIAALSYTYVEQPLLRLKNKFTLMKV